tara:strand:+ start:392 stop:577 length:186 start_codon:yes stop_codon:yes gene_type:complete
MEHDYYDNLVKAIGELSSRLEKQMTDLSEEEQNKWVTSVIQSLSEKYEVLKIDLDEMHQYM